MFRSTRVHLTHHFPAADAADEHTPCSRTVPGNGVPANQRHRDWSCDVTVERKLVCPASQSELEQQTDRGCSLVGEEGEDSARVPAFFFALRESHPTSVNLA